jgi:two-component system, chemotaxis family, CheB/CheR fusion protein
METFPIVVVASSARDLEPVVELLSASPAGGHPAFIIVQHPDVDRRYIPLNDALAKRVSQPVVLAQDGVLAKRGHVYVLRTDAEVAIIGGLISVVPAARAVQHPADVLLTSLAADRGSRAIGVVLSGPGTDGALGVRSIKRAGGITFAQYPGSARFPSMPINTIETGCAGWVLRPNEIALELARLSAVPPRSAAQGYPVSTLRELVTPG